MEFWKVIVFFLFWNANIPPSFVMYEEIPEAIPMIRINVSVHHNGVSHDLAGRHIQKRGLKGGGFPQQRTCNSCSTSDSAAAPLDTTETAT